MKLTKEQEIILDSSHKNIYVSAAPGSGKSTMLSHITNKLLLNINNYVLLVTFTNKAAKSIISKCDDVDQTRIMGGTFHGLANRFIRNSGYKWNICDEGKKRLIIKKIFDCRKDKERFNTILDTISQEKSKWPYEPGEYGLRYNEELNKYSLVDFDDMIYSFINNCSILSYPKITHILVDELQDTSGPQLEMLKKLQKKLDCNMIGVADDDQAIYAWRGARPENVKDFIDTFDCEILNMGYNFRSNVRIVEASDKLIRKNKKRIDKIIKPFKKEKGLITSYKCQNTFNEIDYIVMKCKQNLSEDIAILYRNRTYKNHLEFALKKAKIDYCVNDTLEIVDRSAIKVMLSCMKIAATIGDIYDLEIAAKGLKGIGKTTIDTLKKEVTKEDDLASILRNKFYDVKQVKKYKSLLNIISFFSNNKGKPLDFLARNIEKYFIQSFDYQADMKNFIIDITQGYKITATDIRDLCNDLGLDGKGENNDNTSNIELSTVHGYKGLEKDIVMMPWTQMYLDPTNNKIIDIEDERRLFYVAITRAKEKLFLCYSGNKPKFIKELK